MSTSEDRLQALIAEERVMKSILEEVRSKYLQLQVEHMVLSRSHKTLLLNSLSHQSESTSTTAADQDDPLELASSKASSSVIEEQSTVPTDSSVHNLSEIGRLQFDNESNIFCDAEYSHMYETQSDESISEDDLDDPSIMNKYQLNMSSLQAKLKSSEEELSE